MNKKNVFAVGYPIGFSFVDDVEYYNIQVNEIVYPLNLLSAFIWMGALSGNKTKETLYESVIDDLESKGYVTGKDFTIDNLDDIYYQLLSASLLIEVDENEDVEKFIDDYQNLRLSRKGFGVGVDFDKISIYEDGKNIEVNPFEYYIWQVSAESRTIKETYLDYKNSVENSVSQLGGNVDEVMDNINRNFLKSIVGLYNHNLIYIVGN